MYRIVFILVILIVCGCALSTNRQTTLSVIYDPIQLEEEQAISIDRHGGGSEHGNDYDYDRGAWELVRSGRYEDAVNEYSAILQELRDRGDAQWRSTIAALSRRRGIAKLLADDLNGAIDDFSIVISIDPDDAYAVLHRMKAYRRLGRADAAKSDRERGYRIDAELFSRKLGEIGQGGVL